MDEHDEIIDECGRKFGSTFFTLFLELWQRTRSRSPRDEEIDPGLREQLELYRDRLGSACPRPSCRSGPMLTFLRCWTRLYGAVTPGGVRPPGVRARRCRAHVRLMLAEMATQLGLEYPPRLDANARS